METQSLAPVAGAFNKHVISWHGGDGLGPGKLMIPHIRRQRLVRGELGCWGYLPKRQWQHPSHAYHCAASAGLEIAWNAGTGVKRGDHDAPTVMASKPLGNMRRRSLAHLWKDERSNLSVLLTSISLPATVHLSRKEIPLYDSRQGSPSRVSATTRERNTRARPPSQIARGR